MYDVLLKITHFQLKIGLNFEPFDFGLIQVRNLVIHMHRLYNIISNSYR